MMQKFRIVSKSCSHSDACARRSSTSLTIRTDVVQNESALLRHSLNKEFANREGTSAGRCEGLRNARRRFARTWGKAQDQPPVCTPAHGHPGHAQPPVAFLRRQYT